MYIYDHNYIQPKGERHVESKQPLKIKKKLSPYYLFFSLLSASIIKSQVSFFLNLCFIIFDIHVVVYKYAIIANIILHAMYFCKEERRREVSIQNKFFKKKNIKKKSRVLFFSSFVNCIVFSPLVYLYDHLYYNHD